MKELNEILLKVKKNYNQKMIDLSNKICKTLSHSLAMGVYEDLSTCYDKILIYKQQIDGTIPDFKGKQKFLSDQFERMLKIAIEQFDQNIEEVITNQKRIFAETQKMTDDLEKKQKAGLKQQMKQLESQLRLEKEEKRKLKVLFKQKENECQKLKQQTHEIGEKKQKSVIKKHEREKLQLINASQTKLEKLQLQLVKLTDQNTKNTSIISKLSLERETFSQNMQLQEEKFTSAIQTLENIQDQKDEDLHDLKARKDALESEIVGLKKQTNKESIPLQKNREQISYISRLKQQLTIFQQECLELSQRIQVLQKYQSQWQHTKSVECKRCYRSYDSVLFSAHLIICGRTFDDIHSMVDYSNSLTITLQMSSSKDKRYIQHIYDICMRDTLQETKLKIRRSFKSCTILLKKLLKYIPSTKKEKHEHISKLSSEYSQSSSIFIENHPDYLEQKRQRLEKAFKMILEEKTVLQNKTFQKFFMIDDKIGTLSWRNKSKENSNSNLKRRKSIIEKVKSQSGIKKKNVKSFVSPSVRSEINKLKNMLDFNTIKSFTKDQKHTLKPHRSNNTNDSQ